MLQKYASRLVLDRKNESISLLKSNGKYDYVVISRCCYRPFTEQKFDEIVFLAIFQSAHMREYGTRLMAKIKARTKKLG